MQELKKLETFKFWCQKVLPLVYEDSLSYYENLCKVIHYLNNVIESQNTVIEVVNISKEQIEKLKEEMRFVLEELEKIKNGSYISVYVEALKDWIDRNLQELVGRVVKYVCFGLSQDGHFIALIPETWQFIHFDTIIDPNNQLYGHLLLQW